MVRILWPAGGLVLGLASTLATLSAVSAETLSHHEPSLHQRDEASSTYTPQELKSGTTLRWGEQAPAEPTQPPEETEKTITVTLPLETSLSAEETVKTTISFKKGKSPTTTLSSSQTSSQDDGATITAEPPVVSGTPIAPSATDGTTAETNAEDTPAPSAPSGPEPSTVNGIVVPLTATATNAAGEYGVTTMTWFSTITVYTAGTGDQQATITAPAWACDPPGWCAGQCHTEDSSCEPFTVPHPPELSGYPLPTPPYDETPATASASPTQDVATPSSTETPSTPTAQESQIPDESTGNADTTALPTQPEQETPTEISTLSASALSTDTTADATSTEAITSTDTVISTDLGIPWITPSTGPASSVETSALIDATISTVISAEIEAPTSSAVPTSRSSEQTTPVAEPSSVDIPTSLSLESPASSTPSIVTESQVLESSVSIPSASEAIDIPTSSSLETSSFFTASIVTESQTLEFSEPVPSASEAIDENTSTVQTVTSASLDAATSSAPSPPETTLVDVVSTSLPGPPDWSSSILSDESPASSADPVSSPVVNPTIVVSTESTTPTIVDTASTDTATSGSIDDIPAEPSIPIIPSAEPTVTGTPVVSSSTTSASPVTSVTENPAVPSPAPSVVQSTTSPSVVTTANEPEATPTGGAEEQDGEEEEQDGEDEENDDEDNNDDQNDNDKGDDNKGNDNKGDDDDDDDGGGVVLFPFIIFPPFPRLPNLPGFPDIPWPPPPPPPGAPPPPPPPPPGSGEDGENEEEDERPTTTASEASCTAEVTIAPNCSQECHVYPITESEGFGPLPTTSYSTTCMTAGCETITVCSSVATSTETSYSTATAAPYPYCEQGRCNGKQCNIDDANNALAVRGIGDGDEILEAELSSPDTWPRGRNDWWKKMWRVVMDYGARTDDVQTSQNHPVLPGVLGVSSSRFRAFTEEEISLNHGDGESFGLGGGSGPIWGCTVVIAVSKHGVYTNHLWQVPNFVIPPGQEGTYNQNKEVYFQNRIVDFLRNGEMTEDGSEELYPALIPLLQRGQRLDANSDDFFGIWIISPWKSEAEILQSPDEVNRIRELLMEEGHVPEGQIIVQAYRQTPAIRQDWGIHGEDKDEPGPGIPVSTSHSAGLASWIYASGKDGGPKGLAVRFEEYEILNTDWCSTADAPLRSRQEGTTPDKDEFLVASEDGKCVPFKCKAGGLCETCRPPSSLAKRGPTSGQEILANFLTAPETWDTISGPREWWFYTWQLSLNRGAKIDYVDEEFTTSKYHEFAKQVDGKTVVEPAGGGTGPIVGCTSLLIASPKGTFVAHFWEDPTFSNDDKNMEDLALHFLEDIVDHLDKHLKPLTVKRGDPFHAESLRWIKVFLITPNNYDMKGGRPRDVMYYEDTILKFQKYLKDECKLDSKVRIYERHMNEIGDFSEDSADYADGSFRDNWGKIMKKSKGKFESHMGLVSWQFSPGNEDDDSGKPAYLKGYKGDIRQIVLRFEREILFQQAWCGDGLIHDGDPEYKEDSKVPDMCSTTIPHTLCGGCGSCVQNPDDSESDDDESMPDAPPDDPKRQLSARDDEEELKKLLRAPFPDKWPAGETDWWDKMQQVAKSERWGTPYRGRNIVDEDGNERGEYLSSTHAQTFYDTLPGQMGGVPPVFGCFSIVVASAKGIWYAHIWEVPTFTLGVGTSAHEYLRGLFPKTQQQYYKEGVTDIIQKGTSEYWGLKPLMVSEEPFNVVESEWFWVGIGAVVDEQDGEDELGHAAHIDAGLESLRAEFHAIGLQDADQIHVLPYKRVSPMSENRKPWEGLMTWHFDPKTDDGSHLRITFDGEAVFERNW